MRFRSPFFFLFLALALPIQLGAQSSSSKRRLSSITGSLEPGLISNGTYQNRSLGLTCKIPEGWVVRTDEMNQPQAQLVDAQKDPPSQPVDAKPPSMAPRVLLAVFSRPPDATGAEVNSSILIAAEPVTAYPGLKEAEQYFGPLSEVAEAQGFTRDADPYEIAIGQQTLVRADFHKDVGTRVMRQSTLVLLSHGYAASVTVIAGSPDGVAELLNALDFKGPGRSAK